MLELHSFEQQNKAEKPTMEEKLHEEYPELESKLTFTWPLSERRRKAIEMLNSGTFEPKMVSEFLESSDFVERKVGMFLIKEYPATLKDFSEETYTKIQSILKRGNFEMGASAEARIKILVEFQGDKALPILEKIISEDKSPEKMFIREEALRAKIKILAETQDEKALPVLEKILKDNKYRHAIREPVIQAFGHMGEKALPILEKMVFDNNYYLERPLLIGALGNIGGKALPILEKLRHDSEYSVKEAVVKEEVIRALSNIGKKALPILERISEDKKEDLTIRIAAGQAIIETRGKKALSTLKKMSEEESQFFKEEAGEAIDKQKQPPWSTYQRFLLSRKPLFATPYTKELAQRIIKISEIVKELQNKFQDKFIGLTIFGSTAKGYFKPESDLDYGMIAKDEEVSKHFKRGAASLHLCFEHYAQVGKRDTLESKRDVLFYGLFFGNRQKLLELQEKILETTNEKGWDNIRKFIMEQETEIGKAKERFNLKEKELEKIKQFALLLRVPPPREEALNAIRSRRQKE